MSTKSIYNICILFPMFQTKDTIHTAGIPIKNFTFTFPFSHSQASPSTACVNSGIS